MRAFLAIVFLVLIGAGGYWAYQHYQPTALDSVAEVSLESEIQALESLKDRAPDAPKGGEAELAAFVKAFSTISNATVGNIETDAQGAVAKDVVFVTLHDAQIGLRIKELRLWGADVSALEAIANGGGTGGVLARRIDAVGVEFFGFEKLIESAMKAYVDSLTAIADSAVGANAASPFEILGEQAVSKLDISVDRAVVEGFAFYPPAVAPEIESASGLMPLLSKMARWGRSHAFEEAAFYGLSSETVMSLSTGEQKSSSGAAFVGYRGYDRGDIRLLVARDMSTSSEMPLNSLSISTSFERYGVDGFKLANLFRFLEKGALPPKTETNAMSLGVWRSEGERMLFGDNEVSFLKSGRADFSKFYWLVPTEMSFLAEGGVYKVAALIDFLTTTGAIGVDDSAAVEVKQMLSRYSEALEKFDMLTISFDGDFESHWNPESGAAGASANISLADLADIEEKVEVAAPNFEAFSGLAPKDDGQIDWEAVKSLLTEGAALKHFNLGVRDDGGVAKGFGLAVEFAKLAPEDDQQAAMLRNANPEDLRLSSAAMIRMMSAQAAQQFPPATQYFGAIADFIQNGGTLRAVADPSSPVGLADLEAVKDSPEEVVSLLGFSLTHEPSAEKAGE